MRKGHEKHVDPVVEAKAEEIYTARYGDQREWALVQTPKGWWHDAEVALGKERGLTRRPTLESRPGEAHLRLTEAWTVEQVADVVQDFLFPDSGIEREILRDVLIALARVMRGEPPSRTIYDPISSDDP